MRQKALTLCLKMQKESTIQIPYTTQLREAGFQLFDQRPDKGYSLTDCISMIVMKEMKITEILTHDRHFTQEGFKILF